MGASLCKVLNFVSSVSVVGLRRKSLVGCGLVGQGFEVWFEVCLRTSSLVREVRGWSRSVAVLELVLWAWRMKSVFDRPWLGCAVGWNFC